MRGVLLSWEFFRRTDWERVSSKDEGSFSPVDYVVLYSIAMQAGTPLFLSTFGDPSCRRQRFSIARASVIVEQAECHLA
jgi:hypothetical protein